jgi:hypothetical protein
MTARIAPAEARTCSRDRMTGGACTRFWVNTAAADAGGSETMRATSSVPVWPRFLSPAEAEAKRNPRGRTRADRSSLIFYLREYEVRVFSCFCRLDSYSVGRGKLLIDQIAGIEYALRFKAKDFSFFIRAGPVLDSAGNNKTLPGSQSNHVVSKLDAKIPLPDQEQFIFLIVVMPGKLALHFDDFDFLAIQSRDDFGPPMFAEQGKLLVQIDLGQHSFSI